MGAPGPRPIHSLPEDTKVGWASDRRRIHVTCMVVESSFRTDPRRLGPVVVAWTAARAGTVEPVVSQYKVEAAVAPAAADGVVVVAVVVVVAAAAAGVVVASDAVTVGVAAGVAAGVGVGVG